MENFQRLFFGLSTENFHCLNFRIFYRHILTTMPIFLLETVYIYIYIYIYIYVCICIYFLKEQLEKNNFLIGKTACPLHGRVNFILGSRVPCLPSPRWPLWRSQWCPPCYIREVKPRSVSHVVHTI
jgi:hypothetical protein